MKAKKKSVTEQRRERLLELLTKAKSEGAKLRTLYDLCIAAQMAFKQGVSIGYGEFTTMMLELYDDQKIAQAGELRNEHKTPIKWVLVEFVKASNHPTDGTTFLPGDWAVLSEKVAEEHIALGEVRRVDDDTGGA